MNRVISVSGEVRLTVAESDAVGEDLRVGAGNSVIAGGGPVTLQAGDNVRIEGLVHGTTTIRKFSIKV